MTSRWISWLFSLATVFGLLTASTQAARGAPGLDLPWWLSEEVRTLQEDQIVRRSQLKSLPAFLSPSAMRVGFHSGFSVSRDQVDWVQVDLGYEQLITTIALVPASLLVGNEVAEGYAFPVRFRIQVSNDPDFGRATLAVDQTAADYLNPGRYPFLARGLELKGRYVRVTVTRTANEGSRQLESGRTIEGGRPFFALGELMVLSGNRIISIKRPVQASSSLEVENSWSTSFLCDDQYALPLPMSNFGSATNGFLSQASDTANHTHWVQLDLGQDYPIDEVRLVPARPIGQLDLPGWGFPMGFRVDTARKADLSDAVTLCDFTETPFRHRTDQPLVLPADTRELRSEMEASKAGTNPPGRFPAPPLRARYVRLTANLLDTRLVPMYLALAEMQVYSREANVASQATVSYSDAAGPEAGRRWSPEALVDDFTSRSRLLEFPFWLDQIERRREIEAELILINQRLDEAVLGVWSRLGFTAGGSATFAIVLLIFFNWRQTRRMSRQTEELRTQIASDLHDDIGSNLGTIALLVQTIGRQQEMSANLQADLEEIRSVALETGDSMRDIVWLMRPAASRLSDFAGKLRTTVARMLPDQEVSFVCPETLPTRDMSLTWRRAVFLTFKETLHNASRHSQATSVRIEVSCTPDRMRIEVADNGVGFDQSLPVTGLGRESMRKRLRELGGTVTFASAPGSGAIVTIDAPFYRPRPRWLRWLGRRR